MFAFIMPFITPIFGAVITPFVKAWSDYKLAKIKADESGFEAGAVADVKMAQVVATSEVANNALKVQVAGNGINKFVMWVVGAPIAVHFSLVTVDTILASPGMLGHPFFGTPPMPGQYETYGFAIIESFFLIKGVHVATSNVSQWLGRSS